jgi:hypothetical protein
MFLVGPAQDFAAVGSGGAQEPFIIHAGDHVLKFPVAVFGSHLGVEGFDARTEKDGAYFDFHLLRLLMQIDGVGLTHAFADEAFFLFQVNAAFIDIGHQGDGLGKVHMGGLVLADALIERVRVFHRTVLHTGGAAGTLLLDDVSRFLGEGDQEVSCFPFHAIHFGICENLYVRMPADLDQFR